MVNARISVPHRQLTDFGQRWHIQELALFGSVLREDFRDDSDVDVLVSFEEDCAIGLWEMADMLGELEALFGRDVDLVEKEGLQNPFRRRAILDTREIVYAA